MPEHQLRCLVCPAGEGPFFDEAGELTQHLLKRHTSGLRRRRPHVRFVFAWYDIWFGARIDREDRSVYLMIPFVGVNVWYG